MSFGNALRINSVLRKTAIVADIKLYTATLFDRQSSFHNVIVDKCHGVSLHTDATSATFEIVGSARNSVTLSSGTSTASQDVLFDVKTFIILWHTKSAFKEGMIEEMKEYFPDVDITPIIHHPTVLSFRIKW